MRYTIADCIRNLGPSPGIERLPAPVYNHNELLLENPIALAVSSMRDHLTDEGWQIMQALETNGYVLYGRGIQNHDTTNVVDIVDQARPTTVVVQDKRECDPST
jgi:hypothetical protein